MPLVKEDLITSGTTVYPFDSYVRIARVLQVNLFSREMIVQYVDGETDELTGDFLEAPVTATCIVGSDDPDTTYAPSCVVYGRGDIVNILVLASGQKHAISPCDLYNNVNRENFATIGGWALYDVLSGILVDGLDDTTTPENSYLTFRRDFNGPIYSYFTVTKITGDPTKRHIMRRMLDYFLSMQTQSMHITSVTDPSWTWSQNHCGPDNNPMRRIHGRMHKGKRVCGFPYVEDIDFTNDVATLENNITAYHPTAEGLKTGSIHPLSVGSVITRYFEGATVVWFDDEEPTHVLLIGCYPAWASCKYIVFAEVSVYSMTGRKFLEREIIDEGLPTEEIGDILQSWQIFGNEVRIIHTIDRSTYADFPAHESDIEFSDRMQKNVAAYLPTQTGNLRDFGMLDGHGWGQGGTVFDVNKVKSIVGTIERTARDPDPTIEGPASNGSMWNYEILHNDPLTTGYLDLNYSIHFRYVRDDAATPPIWESQVSNNPTKEFNCYNDGVNSMERTCDFDYYCEGWYSEAEPITGRIGWSDGGGHPWASNAQNFDNYCWHKTYRNGGHLLTEYYHLKKTGFQYEGEETKYVLMYADVEYDLFVYLKVETWIDPHDSVGPGWTFLETLGTHWQRHSGVVIFEGTEWTIWTYFIPLVTFPTIYNFFPWLSDVGATDRPYQPESPYFGDEYDVDENHTSYYFHEPQFYIWNGTLKTGYTTAGIGWPGPTYGPSSMPTWQIQKTEDYAYPDDLLQVSVDYENDSFCVIFESFYQTDTPNGKILTYPNGGNALYSFNGETPHYNKPAVTDTIEL